jgi:hypothetical protein
VFGLILSLFECWIDIASFVYFTQFIEEQKKPLEEKIQKEIDLSKKDEISNSKKNTGILIRFGN